MGFLICSESVSAFLTARSQQWEGGGRGQEGEFFWKLGAKSFSLEKQKGKIK